MNPAPLLVPRLQRGSRGGFWSGATFTEAYNDLFARPEAPTLKTVALRKLDGMSSDEIADELVTSRRTVDRKPCLIRAIREEEFSK